MKKILFTLALFATLSAYSLVSAQEEAFTKSLYFGIQSDTEATKLQEFLTDEGLYMGPITGNIFSLTVKSIKKFQEREGISPTGYFGALTRARANELLGNQIQGSKVEAIAETGTSTLIVEKPKTTNDVVLTLQAQLQALLQQVELLKQQQITQQEASKTVKDLQAQVVKQTETIQQQNTTIQQIQQNTQQIQQNTTTPVVQPQPTPVAISQKKIEVFTNKTVTQSSGFGVDEVAFQVYVTGDTGNNVSNAVLKVEATDGSQNKTLSGTGNFCSNFHCKNGMQSGYYYAFQYSPKISGTNAVTISVPSLELTKVVNIEVTPYIEIAPRVALDAGALSNGMVQKGATGIKLGGIRVWGGSEASKITQIKTKLISDSYSFQDIALRYYTDNTMWSVNNGVISATDRIQTIPVSGNSSTGYFTVDLLSKVGKFKLQIDEVTFVGVETGKVTTLDNLSLLMPEITVSE